MIRIQRNNLLSLSKMRMVDAYNLFLESRKSFCSQATVDIYTFQQRYIVNGINIEYMEDVDPDAIRQFLKEFRETHNDGGTFHLYSSIRAFFNWYWEEYELEIRNPISKVKCKRPSVVKLRACEKKSVKKSSMKLQ